MKRLILLPTLVTILAILAASPASDGGTSSAGDNLAEDEMTIGSPEESGPSASATITITMYAVDDE